ncbi:MAG: MarR family transcriptional regulator [Hyphomicrobiaceae bacterium]
MSKASTGKDMAMSELSAIHLLHRAGQCADELFAKKIGKSDLTPRQFAVLMSVSKSEDLSQTALVDATGIDRSTLADIVRRLVERGLLVRKRTKQDARMYAVRLSAAGRHAIESAAPGAVATNDALLASLPVSQRSVFVNALQKIVETMGPISSAKVASKSRQRAADIKEANRRGGRG